MARRRFRSSSRHSSLQSKLNHNFKINNQLTKKSYHLRSIGLVGLGGSQDLAELHVVSARHLRHGRGQLSGGNATVLAGQFLAAATLLPVAAFALHLHQLLAGGFWAGALVAGC